MMITGIMHGGFRAKNWKHADGKMTFTQQMEIAAKKEHKERTRQIIEATDRNKLLVECTSKSLSVMLKLGKRVAPLKTDGQSEAEVAGCIGMRKITSRKGEPPPSHMRDDRYGSMEKNGCL